MLRALVRFGLQFLMFGVIRVLPNSPTSAPKAVRKFLAVLGEFDPVSEMSRGFSPSAWP